MAFSFRPKSKVRTYLKTVSYESISTHADKYVVYCIRFSVGYASPGDRSRSRWIKRIKKHCHLYTTTSIQTPHELKKFDHILKKNKIIKHKAKTKV